MAQTTADTRVGLKIVVIDDDPTGSQTVHGCPLLLRWDGEALAAGLAHPSPLLFLLANTRALAPEAAAERVRGICGALRPALERAVAAGRIGGWLLVSRGDSTLRGHFPLEVEVIAAELGPFDATLLVPAFLEGGRTTVDGVHLLQGRPVHRSPFARDGLFGYSTSFLPDWVAQKSGGRIPAEAVDRIGREELDGGGAELTGHLARLEGNVCVVVDGASPAAGGPGHSGPRAVGSWRPRRSQRSGSAPPVPVPECRQPDPGPGGPAAPAPGPGGSGGPAPPGRRPAVAGAGAGGLSRAPG